MRKSKRWLAVFLAVLMMATPAAEVYAANSTTASVSENDVIVDQIETETTEAVEDTVEEVIDSEEITEEVSEEVLEESSEEITGETVVEEETEEIITEEVTTEEVTTEEITTEEMTTEEETTEEMTTEEYDEHNWNGSGHKAPKLEMNLSNAMVAEKVELQGTLKRLEDLDVGVQYVANEAVFIADTKSYANKVAEGYGAVLDSYESGVAVISFEEDVTEIIAMAEDMDVMLPAVYPNYIYTTSDDILMEYIPEGENIATALYISDDANSNQQYYHLDINTKRAWKYNNAAGKGIKVAVLDSGIDTNHPELKGKSSASVTHPTPYNKGADNNGHGTHVAGIIAAKKDNQAYGAGVAYNASILSIKVLENNPITNRANGDTAGIIKAINKAVSSGARVINMSLGGFYYDALFEAAVDKAVNKGVVVVSSAGNDTRELSTSPSSANFYSPACFENVITVSATETDSATIADFSNFGNGIIDIAAPGTEIYSCIPTALGGDASYEGTSQATPQVAAAAAYILSVSPDLAKNKTKATVDTVKQILKDSANKSEYSNTTYFGAGLLDVEAAVKMAAPSAVNDTELKAPTVKVADAAVTNNQVIQDTDPITLTSTLGSATNNNIKIYYTTDGKTPTEKSTLYTGEFTLPASGNKTIKALAVYYGKKSAVTTVKVKVNAYPTNFTLTSNTGVWTVASGKSLQIKATDITPSYTTNKTVTWTITEGSDFATIKNGKVTANKNITEEETIIVEASMNKAGGVLTRTVPITILPVAQKIELSNKADASVALTYPNTKKMSVTVTPAGINPPITYSSSNTKVATVDSSGTIKSVGNGKATITAKTADGSNKSVKMTVAVTKPVQSITVTSKTGLNTIAAGKSLVFVADVTKDATNRGVDWKVETITSGASLEGISIKNGTLSTKTTVKKVTQVRVTATAKDGSGKYDSATATIYPSTTKKVALEGGTTYNLGTKAKGTLKTYVQLLPYTDGYTTDFMGRKKGSGNTNLSNFTYKSSNVKVATVSSTGYVTALAPGSAKITITANDGSKKSVSCTIKVVNPVTYISLISKSGISIVGKGKSMSLGASVNADATNKKLRWSSSNTSVATVNSSGKVTGKSYSLVNGYSQATITAEATDGSGIYQQYTIKVIPAVANVWLPIWRSGYWRDWDETGESYFNSSAKTTMYRGSHYILPEAYFKLTGYSGVSNTGDLVDVTCSNSNVIQLNWYVDEKDEVYGVLSPVNKGTANITYKALDGSGKKATLKVTVY